MENIEQMDPNVTDIKNPTIVNTINVNKNQKSFLPLEQYLVSSFLYHFLIEFLNLRKDQGMNLITHR